MTHPKKEADTFRVGYHFGMIILFLIGLFASTAHAYIDYAPNANLIEEVNSHPFRLFPKSDHYAFAVDADFFKPVFIGDLQSNYYRYDAYHGNGYWLTLRGEYKPVQQVTLDLKTIVTHGTSSNGPTYNAIIVPMVGITYQEDLLGFNVKFRLSDIGRQTVGTGLFIE